ncbi:MBL fold metallo-hydrolase [Chloroflexota bacterium]
MKIKWLGHASFLITSDAGTKIITDPYTPGGLGLNYGEIKESADIVTVSHGHGDHNNVAAVRGNPKIIKDTTTWVIPVVTVGTGIPELPRGSKEIKGMGFNAIPTYHDDAGGNKRGNNNMFCFEVDGIRICHLGDLGHPLSDKQAAELGKVDVLLIPVGGNFTIDAGAATEVCTKLKPKVIVPMHYKNERCSSFPVAGVDEFLKSKKGVIRPDTSEIELKKDGLPATSQIIVLKPAL